MKRTGLYAIEGPILTHYHIDADAFSLTRGGSVRLPENIHCICQHATMPFMYVASSNRVSNDQVGTDHHLSVLRIDVSGAVSPHGSPLQLPYRPVHVTTDASSENLLIAFNDPSDLHIYRIRADGAIGERVEQRNGIDMGVFAHQIRVSPDDQLAILVTRGNPLPGRKPEEHVTRQVDPGALKVFQYAAGVLGEEASIAPEGGHYFGARWLDFHPHGPWIYLSLEMQNKLYVFKREGRRIDPEPLFRRELLATPGNPPTHQGGGVLQVHPNGRFVYGVNRAHFPAQYQGQRVLIGADNSFAVFSINEATGEPTLIQHMDSGGVYPIAFAVHPNGRMLVAANGESHRVKRGNEVLPAAANLALFEIKNDGTLEFARKYEVEPGTKSKLSMCMVNY